METFHIETYSVISYLQETILVSSLPLLITLPLREDFSIGQGSGSAIPYSQLLRFSSLLTGVAVGLLFVNDALINNSPSLKLFITRATPGAIMLILFWKLIPKLNVFSDELFVYYTLRYCSFFLIALWITFLWPLLNKHLCSQFKCL